MLYAFSISKKSQLGIIEETGVYLLLKLVLGFKFNVKVLICNTLKD